MNSSRISRKWTVSEGIIWTTVADSQGALPSCLRTSIRASQICINRFQIKDLCQDWNKEYLLQATFPSFVPPGDFVESLFSGIEGSQAGPESFGNEVMLGISLNIQETIGHKAREGISYIIHPGWAGSSQILSILRQTRWILVAVIWIYFGVLSSPNPTSLLLDYDLVTCQRARQILGQVSTAVPCMKDGKIDRYFQVKGLIV